LAKQQAYYATANPSAAPAAPAAPAADSAATAPKAEAGKEISMK